MEGKEMGEGGGGGGGEGRRLVLGAEDGDDEVFHRTGEAGAVGWEGGLVVCWCLGGKGAFLTEGFGNGGFELHCEVGGVEGARLVSYLASVRCKYRSSSRASLLNVCRMSLINLHGPSPVCLLSERKSSARNEFRQ